jgi:hypothetical protein
VVLKVAKQYFSPIFSRIKKPGFNHKSWDTKLFGVGKSGCWVIGSDRQNLGRKQRVVTGFQKSTKV